MEVVWKSLEVVLQMNLFLETFVSKILFLETLHSFVQWYFEKISTQLHFKKDG